MNSPNPIPLPSENSTISSTFYASSEPTPERKKELQLKDEAQKIVNRLQYDRTLTAPLRDILTTDLCLIEEELSGLEARKEGRNG